MQNMLIVVVCVTSLTPGDQQERVCVKDLNPLHNLWPSEERCLEEKEKFVANFDFEATVDTAVTMFDLPVDSAPKRYVMSAQCAPFLHQDDIIIDKTF